MSATMSICRDDGARRTALRAAELNGLDYLEVDETDRHRLTIVFMAKLGRLRDELTAANFVVSGGVRVRDLVVTGLEVCPDADPERDDCAVVTVDHIGDFSTYTLRVVEREDGRPTDTPHHAFDPVYGSIDFSFQVGCPSPLDCEPRELCPEPRGYASAIDYLSKDYASFRQLLLDRLDLLVPGWHEVHEPDLLVTLVELLAYEGDRLSYLQDAVATEAYLQTARRRVSVRRHARLVDYYLHEGCNARAWVFVETSEDTDWMALEDIFFVTSYRGVPPPGTVLSDRDLVKVPPSWYEVFEPIQVARAAGSGRPAPGLARRMLEGGDRVAEFVRDQLQQEVRAALAAWDGDGAPPAALDQRLLDELDRIAHDQALHTAAPFREYMRNGEAYPLLRRPLHGEDVVELNWLLLHAAFAEELAPPAGVRFLTGHNRIVIHTWGERDCCLPRGTTAAALVDEGLQLAPGDWLLLEEVLDPGTGLEEDADPAHRHVVRLTRVTATRDPVLDVSLLEVEWAPEDALPFPLCLSAQGPAPDCEWFEEITVARANVVLVDHGRRRLQELDAVEVAAVDEPCDQCRPEQELVPTGYTPVLDAPDLTFAEPLAADAPASTSIAQDPRLALPQVRLQQVALAPPRLEDPDPLERYRNPVPLTVLDPEDLVGAEVLVARLQQASQPNVQPSADPLATYLLGLLDETTRGLLAAHQPGSEPEDDLVAGILRALNVALDDQDLDEEERFPRDSLDEETKTLSADTTLPLDLRRLLRRWLLEQGLEGAVAPTQHDVETWLPRYDLLASTGDDRHFVVEMTDDRRASLRFGDDDLGRRPEAVSRFRARYRVGTGPNGNVGAEAITYLVHAGGLLEGLSLRPRNPLPARGGTSPESLDHARRLAPAAIRHDLARAVIAQDYADLAARDFSVQLQGAAADLVWTGSWYEAYVGLDPLGREDVAADFGEGVEARLERYRRIGHGLRVAAADYVPLDITVAVCVESRHLRAHVLAELEDAFCSGLRSDGRPGFFHPDNLRFRTSIDVSEIVALAQQTEGVVWAAVTKLERTGEGPAGEVDAGTLPVGALEIARVDSRRGFPEYGSITFDLEGGR
jgi:predicted phage baseplate assembly protein